VTKLSILQHQFKKGHTKTDKVLTTLNLVVNFDIWLHRGNCSISAVWMLQVLGDSAFWCWHIQNHPAGPECCTAKCRPTSIQWILFAVWWQIYGAV